MLYDEPTDDADLVIVVMLDLETDAAAAAASEAAVGKLPSDDEVLLLVASLSIADHQLLTTKHYILNDMQEQQRLLNTAAPYMTPTSN